MKIAIRSKVAMAALAMVALNSTAMAQGGAPAGSGSQAPAFAEDSYSAQINQPVQSSSSSQSSQLSQSAQSAPQPIRSSPLPLPMTMVITTTLNVDGYRIVQYKGIVRGSSVREPTIGQNFKAGFQGMFGGKVNAYIHMCEQGRQASYDAMVAQAQAMGANAIVGVRYDSNSFSTDQNQFATEVVCYGTAVIVQARPEQ